MGRKSERDRALEQGSSASTADAAPDGKPDLKKRDEEEPYVRPAEPLAHDQKPDQLADQEALLDEAVEETFPGSDPISPKHIT